MQALDNLSEITLCGVNPTVAAMTRAAAEILAGEQTFVRVVSGLRTAKQQEALFAQGRTEPGSIVTYARAGESMHNYGLAVDVVPFLVGHSGQLNWSPATPQFRLMVDAFKRVGFSWGGDWQELKDFDHFQLSGLKTMPTPRMQADYGDGSAFNLRAIWTKVAAGVYTA